MPGARDALWEQAAEIAGRPCACGREHAMPQARVVLGENTLEQLPALLWELQVRKPFMLMDGNTQAAAGARAAQKLRGAGMEVKIAVMPAIPKPQADMRTLPPLLAQAQGCDFVIGVGSGVINDLCKMLGLQAGVRTGVIATAPSMDGYASNSSAMVVDGVKTTIYNHTPAFVLGDLSVLAQAPAALCGAGVGDMAAKAISIAEWRIAQIVTGEYYCPQIARLMLSACASALSSAQGCMRGDGAAVRELTQGLILSGIAMSMAGVSRPASGSEHTMSHLMDMLSIARGEEHRLHGVQVGYGVRVALFMYEALVGYGAQPPDPDAVLRQFDAARWEADMRRMFGAQADGLIRAAADEGRNSPAALGARARKACAGWAEIRAILSEVVAQKQAITNALDVAGIPPLHNPQAIGLTPEDVLHLFVHAKDLRARYIMPAMAFDLGLLPWLGGLLSQALAIGGNPSTAQRMEEW